MINAGGAGYAEQITQAAMVLIERVAALPYWRALLAGLILAVGFAFIGASFFALVFITKTGQAIYAAWQWIITPPAPRPARVATGGGGAT